MRALNMMRYIKNWPQYLFYKFFGDRDSSFLFKAPNNVRSDVPPRLQHTFKESFFGNDYLKGFSNGQIKAPLTVIDIGANVGYFSLFIHSRFPGSAVYAFEPMPNNFKLLKENQLQNDHLDWHIENKAVSGKKGKLVLKYDAEDSYTTAASQYENPYGKDQIIVRTTTLEDIIQGFGLNEIDLLKLDCEGAEYDILYNATPDIFQKIRNIVLETHEISGSNKNAGALSEYLRKFNFKLKRKDDLIWGRNFKV